MKRRSPAAVFWLPVVTFGIYSFVWFAKTRGELNSQGESIPTTWLYIVPVASFWYLWKFATGVSMMTFRARA